MGWDLWNLVATLGVFFIMASVLVFLHNVTRSWRKGLEAGPDPWDARTLEWSIPSPAPEYNFVEIPIVKSRDDFWVKKRSGDITEIELNRSEPNSDIHLPQPSYWPVAASLGMLIGGFGLVYLLDSMLGLLSAVIGGMIIMISVYAWSFEPVNDPEVSDHH